MIKNINYIWKIVEKVRGISINDNIIMITMNQIPTYAKYISIFKRLKNTEY